jgi:hypothetical protein
MEGVPQQAVGGVPLEVIPDLLREIEFQHIRWERFQAQPGLGLAHRLNSWPR